MSAVQSISGIADMATAVMPCDHWNRDLPTPFSPTSRHIASLQAGNMFTTLCTPSEAGRGAESSNVHEQKFYAVRASNGCRMSW